MINYISRSLSLSLYLYLAVSTIRLVLVLGVLEPRELHAKIEYVTGRMTRIHFVAIS